MKEVKFGYTPPLLEMPEMVRLVQLAEENGFESVWLPDHLVNMPGGSPLCPEVWTTLTVFALNTKRMRLAPGVTDPLRRHPAVIAQTVATLDRLSGGRAVLGIGAGEAINTVPYGIDFKRPFLERLREAIEYIKLLWSATVEKRVNYNGRFYRLSNAYMQMNPIQSPHPPIYIGAVGPRNRELVGEVADGWYPWVTTPELYTELLRDVERGAKMAGRSMDEIDAMVRFYTVVSEAVPAKELIVSMCKRTLVHTGHLMKRLDPKHSIREELLGHRMLPTEEAVAALNEAAKEIPTEIAEKVGVFGTTDDCIERIEKYLKAGCNHFCIFIPRPYIEETIKIYGKRIIPYFKKK